MVFLKLSIICKDTRMMFLIIKTIIKVEEFDLI